jgi:excinuclease ABC subunit C
MSLTDQAKEFPRMPGVYLFRDGGDKVIYVGKAKNLRSRVRSYFSKRADDRPQIAFLLKRAKDIEFIVTDTEREALLLENTLIKKHNPRYNLSLRDDKSYISIRIGVEHEAPRISLTRRVVGDGAQYYGPYDSSAAAREAVEQIVRFFKLRTCRDRDYANRVRPCLKYDIGRCTAPCTGCVSLERYALQVEEAQLFLKGRSRELIKRLKGQMAIASSEMEYEAAAHLRDTIGMLEELLEKQKVVRHGGRDHDVIAIAETEFGRAICLMHVSGGTLTARRIYPLVDVCGQTGSVMEEFILRSYVEAADMPPMIALSHRPESIPALEEILTKRRGSSVRLRVPSRGPMKRLVDLAVTNASEALIHKAKGRTVLEVLESLGSRLGLAEGAPEYIECLDISNLSGREAVGSLVVFRDGRPAKTLYRIYNIHTIDTPDDYEMMREVIGRRFNPEVASDGSSRAADRPMPDLLLIDGGRGHLATVERVLGDMGVVIPLAAIAKGGGRDPDRIFIPGRKNSLKLKKGDPELLLFMRIRDEAHRFGIAAHRKKRGKKATGSILEGIVGLGPKRRRLLLQYFGSIAAIRKASIEEISKLPGISEDIARAVLDRLLELA